jgi:hypothetical protein
MVQGSSAGTTVEELADALYLWWYTRQAGDPPVVLDDPPLSRPSLLSALRAAHACGATPSGTWTVTGSTPYGQVSAGKDGAVRLLRPGEYVMALRPGVPAAPGEEVSPTAPVEYVDGERGLWWGFSESPPERPFGRVYLHARPATAARVVHLVSAALRSVPFQLKCPVLPAACLRVDPIVLYHQRAQRRQVLDALTERRDHLRRLLDPAVPPLTCEVDRGIAWADDVDEQRSYGECRCRLLAAAIDANAAVWTTLALDARLALLVRALREAGVDPARPWIDTR